MLFNSFFFPSFFLIRQERVSSSQVEVAEDGYDDFGRRINSNKTVFIIYTLIPDYYKKYIYLYLLFSPSSLQFIDFLG